MRKCYECRSGSLVTVAKPQVLDDTFGPLAKYLFVPTVEETVCLNCGEVMMAYFRLADICDVVRSKHHNLN